MNEATEKHEQLKKEIMLLINMAGLKVWECIESLWLLFQLNLEMNEVTQFWLIQNNNNKF